jgi:hypothetical protein
VAEKDLYLKIGKPNNACASCGAPITHAGKHPSVLLREASAPVTTEDAASDELPGLPSSQPSLDGDSPRREDYCANCWGTLNEKEYYSYWLARREPPKARKIESRKERNAAILAWFDLLRSQTADDENLQAQYFLAHLLMKYGVLKWQRTDTDAAGNEVIYFRQTGTEDDVAVAAVELNDETTAEIKRKLDEYLLQYANAGPAAPETTETE